MKNIFEIIKTIKEDCPEERFKITNYPTSQRGLFFCIGVEKGTLIVELGNPLPIGYIRNDKT